MHTIALLPLVPLSFIAIAFTEHCKKVLGTKHALLQCTSGTESAEKAKEKKKRKKKEKKTLTKTKPVSLRFAAKQLKKTLTKTKPVSLRFAAKQLKKKEDKNFNKN